MAANRGVDLWTAALQFSAAPDVPSALVVGCRNQQQILADYTSMQTKIPDEFWATSPDPIRHRPLTCYPKLRCRYGPTYAGQGCNKVKDPEIWNDGHEDKNRDQKTLATIVSMFGVALARAKETTKICGKWTLPGADVRHVGRCPGSNPVLVSNLTVIAVRDSVSADLVRNIIFDELLRFDWLTPICVN